MGRIGMWVIAVLSGASVALASQFVTDDLVVSNSVAIGGTAVQISRAGNVVIGGRAEIRGNVMEGSGTMALGIPSHAEGSHSIAGGTISHAEGSSTTAAGSMSHAEGSGTKAGGAASHAEGSGSMATGQCSHAEGQDTTAFGNSAHAEGRCTTASGQSSFSGGEKARAANDYSYVWSDGTQIGSTMDRQYTVYAANGIRLLGGPITGNGAGLTNMTAAQVGALTRQEADQRYVSVSLVLPYPVSDIPMGIYTNR